MDSDSLKALSEQVIGAAYEVQNTIGAGFLEKVYERALLRELALRGIAAASQVPFEVRYKGQSVGSYLADIWLRMLWWWSSSAWSGLGMSMLLSV